MMFKVDYNSIGLEYTNKFLVNFILRNKFQFLIIFLTILMW